MYLESSSLTSHADFQNEDAENEGVPYPEVHQDKLPILLNPDGRAQEAEPNGLEEEDLRSLLEDLTN